MTKPYNGTEDKKLQVENMFNNIAPKYDFLNHFLSIGIDKIWRRKVRKILKNEKIDFVLDVATGTGDLAIELSKLKPKKIFGIDLSEQMLKIGVYKIKKKKLNNIIEIEKGDAENLTFESNKFDAVTVAFGVRNFENLQKGLNEMHRVLKQDGKIVVLEFTEPKNNFIKILFNLYFSKILPYIGNLFSRDLDAYKYLPESVKNFPHRDNFIKVLDLSGFKNTKFISLSFGIASLYYGCK